MAEDNQPVSTDDKITRQRIVDGLTNDPGIDSSKMHVAVEKGEVTLTGKADTEAEKQLAEKTAVSIAGAGKVKNHLHIEIGIIHALSSIAAHIQGDIIKNDTGKET